MIILKTKHLTLPNLNWLGRLNQYPTPWSEILILHQQRLRIFQCEDQKEAAKIEGFKIDVI